MFGFKRRAQEREAAAVAAISAAVRERLTAQLAAVRAAALAEPDIGVPEMGWYMANSAEMQAGIDMVLIAGLDAHGPELANDPRHMRAAAMLAHGARNIAIVSGSIENGQTYDDLYRVLRLPRDMSDQDSTTQG